MRFRHGYCDVEFPGSAPPATLPMFRLCGYGHGEAVWARLKGYGWGNKTKGKSLECNRGQNKGTDPRDTKSSTRNEQGEVRACDMGGKRGLSGSQEEGEEKKRKDKEANEERTASGQPCAKKKAHQLLKTPGGACRSRTLQGK